MKVIICEPNKKARVEEIENSLESSQSIVNGYIESIFPFNDNVCIVCNEEGKYLGFKPCRALYDNEELLDIIFGTFFICGVKDEDFSSLTNEQIETYMKKFELPEYFYYTGNKIYSMSYDPED